jgi:phage-related protein
MFKIEFYSTADGTSELWDFLDDLQQRSIKSKDARIQHKQIAMYIQLLEDHGTQLGENITKHLEENIWELRPGNNRVLYFYHKDDTYVLLHQFRKRRKKHLVVKSKRRKLSAMIGLQERSDIYGNLVRLQKPCENNKS